MTILFTDESFGILEQHFPSLYNFYIAFLQFKVINFNCSHLNSQISSAKSALHCYRVTCCIIIAHFSPTLFAHYCFIPFSPFLSIPHPPPLLLKSLEKSKFKLVVLVRVQTRKPQYFKEQVLNLGRFMNGLHGFYKLSEKGYYIQMEAVYLHFSKKCTIVVV